MGVLFIFALVTIFGFTSFRLTRVVLGIVLFKGGGGGVWGNTKTGQGKSKGDALCATWSLEPVSSTSDEVRVSTRIAS